MSTAISRPGTVGGRAPRSVAGLRRRLPAFAGSAFAVAIALQAGIGAADDTEIYFGQIDPNADTSPNVLFVLDTSGSMGAKDGTGVTRLDRMKSAMKDLLRQADDLNVGLMKFNSFYGGGPVLFPVTNINAEVCEGAGCDGTTATAPVLSDGDDVEEYLVDNDVLVNGNVLELMDTNRGEQTIGLRFDKLEVPRGATITDARLVLTASQDGSGGGATLDIRSENTGNAEPFPDEDGSVTNRAWHLSKQSWVLGDWEKGETYYSGNIATIVSQVTSRNDWCGGNALALRIEKSASSVSSAIRHALTFRSATEVVGADGSTRGQVPTLQVTYSKDNLPVGGGCMRTSTSASVAHSGDDAEQNLGNGRVLVNGKVLDIPYAGSAAQEVGVRFGDVRVPRNALVRRAWIEFDAYDRKTGWRAADTSVRIRGQSSSNAPRFQGNKRNISKRGETAASVIWSDLPNPAARTKVETADLTPIVQEIVNYSGWNESNAMAFLFTHAGGTGTRGFTTYNADRSRAARLIIEYDDETGASGTAGARTIKARDEMISLVDSFVASGGTPIVDSLWEASQYFRGRAVEFGKKRGDRNRRYNRLSHPRSYVGGLAVRPSGCFDHNLNATACESEMITGAPIYTSPIESSCQTNHIVLLSDGQAVSNSSAARIRALTGVDSCEASGDEACGVELAQWLYDNDLSSTLNNRQNVRTHTIAFNLADPTFLRDLAKVGGGNLYTANDSGQLLTAFRRIIEGVNAIDTSFVAPGATVNQFNRLTHRDDIYFAMFKPSDTPRWSGNLKRFRVGKERSTAGGETSTVSDSDVLIRDRNGNPAVDPETGFFADGSYSFWPEKADNGVAETNPDGHDVKRGGAANQLALDGLARIGKRRTYTWTGEALAVPAGGVDLTASEQILHEDNDAIGLADLAIDGYGADEAARTAYREELLSWARGVDILDEDEDGVRDEARRHMGDPMHSRPVILNYAIGADQQRSVVFVSTNEGYLHAIDTESGEEQFAFMPGELLKNLAPQFENEAATSHLYGLDGALSIWRTDEDGDYVVDPEDKAYLYVGMRRGGSTYYAFDVSKLDEPRLAWAIQGGDGGTPGFEQLGQSWSRMTPVRMKIDGVDEDVLLFTAGYDETQDEGQTTSDASVAGSVDQLGRGLYVVRATTGELLWAGLGTTSGHRGTARLQKFDDMTFPMPGNVRAIDINRDGLVDQIYTADTGGQVWRFDVDQGHRSGAGDLMQGGVIADLSGSGTADRRRFYAEPDVALVEAGGERFLTVSIGSGWRAHPLDSDVEDRFYVLRQKHVRTKPAADEYGIVDGGLYRPITDADLVAVGDTLDPDVGEHGWYLDFPRSGEKVLGASVTFDHNVIFSSYVPQASVNECSTGIGGGRAYVLDLVSGAPKRDIDEDGDLDLEDQSIALKHGGLPPDAMILITKDGGDEPEILFGGEQVNTGIVNSTRRTFWSDRGEAEPLGPVAADESE